MDEHDPKNDWVNLVASDEELKEMLKDAMRWRGGRQIVLPEDGLEKLAKRIFEKYGLDLEQNT